jgi:hypothetical protein
MVKKMHPRVLGFSIAVAAIAFFIFLPVALKVYAQDKPERETIQATAMGQLTAAGKTFHVTVNIESYSTPEDQKMLIDAFASGGHDALVRKLWIRALEVGERHGTELNRPELYVNGRESGWRRSGRIREEDETSKETLHCQLACVFVTDALCIHGVHAKHRVERRS